MHSHNHIQDTCREFPSSRLERKCKLHFLSLTHLKEEIGWYFLCVLICKTPLLLMFSLAVMTENRKYSPNPHTWPLPSQFWLRQFKVHDVLCLHLSSSTQMRNKWLSSVLGGPIQTTLPLCSLSWLPGSMASHCCLGFFPWRVGDSPLV